MVWLQLSRWLSLLVSITFVSAGHPDRPAFDSNYYELLGVSPTATIAEIKKGYRILALQLHPDKTRELSEKEKEVAEEKFILVTEANTALSDPEVLERYDEILRMGVSNEYSEEIYGKWNERVHERRKARDSNTDVIALGMGALVVVVSIILATVNKQQKKAEAEKSKKAPKSAALSNISKEQTKLKEQEEKDRCKRQFELMRSEEMKEAVAKSAATIKEVGDQEDERDEEEDEKMRHHKQLKNFHRKCRVNLREMALAHSVVGNPAFEETALTKMVEALEIEVLEEKLRDLCSALSVEMPVRPMMPGSEEERSLALTDKLNAAAVLQGLHKRVVAMKDEQKSYHEEQLRTLVEEQKQEREAKQQHIWTHAELLALSRAMKKYAGGHAQRWEAIARLINTEGGGTGTRTGKDCIRQSKMLEYNLTSTAPEPEVTKSSALVEHKQLVEDWNTEQQAAFEKALKAMDKKSLDKWEVVAAAVPGKIKKECILRLP
jgi:curved DNA-binding protein CbpA